MVYLVLLVSTMLAGKGCWGTCVGMSHKLSKIDHEQGAGSSLLRMNQTLLRRKKKKMMSLM